ncbi:MAG: hypothetical protein AzoDbin1_05117 [Azoarcus sp.]|nr:hypothetical protein [Azoarcus sp.]
MDEQHPQQDRLRMLGAIADFISRLTPLRVFLGLMAGAGSVLVYALWESRAQWMQDLLQSQLALTWGFVIIILSALGFIADAMQRRIDGRTNAVEESLRSQLEAERTERRELSALVVAQTTEIARLAEASAAVADAERRCRERVAVLQGSVDEMSRRLDSAGVPVSKY